MYIYIEAHIYINRCMCMYIYIFIYLFYFFVYVHILARSLETSEARSPRLRGDELSLGAKLRGLWPHSRGRGAAQVPASGSIKKHRSKQAVCVSVVMYSVYVFMYMYIVIGRFVVFVHV